MTQQHLDPVTVATAVAATVVGPTLAAVLGPYAVIILGATTGAAWALSRQKEMSRLGAAWYFMRLNATALLLTVSMAAMVNKWGGFSEERWLLAPIALLVGGIGDDWPRVIKWVVGRLGRLVDRRIDNSNKED